MWKPDVSLVGMSWYQTLDRKGTLLAKLPPLFIKRIIRNMKDKMMCLADLFSPGFVSKGKSKEEIAKELTKGSFRFLDKVSKEGIENFDIKKLYDDKQKGKKNG